MTSLVDSLFFRLLLSALEGVVPVLSQSIQSLETLRFGASQKNRGCPFPLNFCNPFNQSVVIHPDEYVSESD